MIFWPGSNIRRISLERHPGLYANQLRPEDDFSWGECAWLNLVGILAPSVSRVGEILPFDIEAADDARDFSPGLAEEF